MRIAVVTEVSTKEKNQFVMEALRDCGHEAFNAGMTGAAGEKELTYIHTGLISALLINGGCADLAVGGCGTGQGYLNSALQYPNMICGLIESPLDAWLFRQINGGNCLSLALNKGFGWAGDANLKFIFQRFFSVERGCGFPAHRKESQQKSRALLNRVSDACHPDMARIVEALPDEALRPALTYPGVMPLLRGRSQAPALLAACEKRLALWGETRE